MYYPYYTNYDSIFQARAWLGGRWSFQLSVRFTANSPLRAKPACALTIILCSLQKFFNPPLTHISPHLTFSKMWFTNKKILDHIEKTLANHPANKPVKPAAAARQRKSKITAGIETARASQATAIIDMETRVRKLRVEIQALLRRGTTNHSSNADETRLEAAKLELADAKVDLAKLKKLW